MTIQEQMKTRDITYAEIAKHLNVSRQYLSAMMTNISEKSSHYEAIVDYVLSHNNSPFLIGDMIANKKGSVGLVLNIDHKTITIQFQDEFKYTDEFNVNNIVRGVFVNPYHKSVYGVGYMGVGRFSSMSHPRIRNCWQTMLQRCYANNLSESMLLSARLKCVHVGTTSRISLKTSPLWTTTIPMDSGSWSVQVVLTINIM